MAVRALAFFFAVLMHLIIEQAQGIFERYTSFFLCLNLQIRRDELSLLGCE